MEQDNKRIRYIKKKISTYKKFDETKCKYLIENVTMMKNMLSQFVQKHPDTDKDSLRNIVTSYLSEFCTKYIDITNFRIDFTTIEVMKELYRDNATFDNMLEKISQKEVDLGKKDKDNGEFKIVNNDMKFNMENLLRALYTQVKIIDNDQNLKNKYIAMKKRIPKNNPKYKHVEMLSKYYEGTIKERIINLLLMNIEDTENKIKDKLIKSTIFIYNFLKDFKMIDRNISRHNAVYKYMGMHGLCYKKTPEEVKDKDDISIEEIFSEEYLKKLNFQQCTALFLFWNNRFAKEIDNVFEGIFAIDQLDLWEDIIDGNAKTKIDMKMANAILNKRNCLRSLSSDILKGVKDENANHKNTEEEQQKDYRQIDVNAKINEIVEIGDELYKSIYDKYIMDNSIDRDLRLQLTASNNEEIIYYMKDKLLTTLSLMLASENKIKNFGIVENEIEPEMNNILVAFDIEGCNMPLRLHLKKEDLIEAFNARKKEPIMQIYDGNEDFYYKGKRVATNLFLPFNKKQVRYLNQLGKQISPDDEEQKNLFEHLRFLSNDKKFPSHLKKDKENRKKYVHLITGKKGTLQELKGEINVTL